MSALSEHKKLEMFEAEISSHECSAATEHRSALMADRRTEHDHAAHHGAVERSRSSERSRTVERDRTVSRPTLHGTTNRQEAEHYPWVSAGIATILLLVMFVEWIRPLMQLSSLTGIHTMEPFVLAIFCFLALDYLRIYAWLAWPLKLVSAWIVISMFFYERPIYDLTWWQQFSAVTMRDLEILLQGNTAILSGENRTMLLLIGLSMMIYSLHYIIVRRHLCGWFTASTISYLAGLQLAFGLDTTTGIVISLVAGLVLAAIVQPAKWRAQLAKSINVRGLAPSFQTGRETSRNAPRIYLRTVGGLFGSIVVIGLAVFTGYWTAAEQPRLSARVDWNIQDFVKDLSMLTRGHLPVTSDRGIVQGIATSGYTLDDYTLGGSVIPADTKVFTAVSDTLTYWRGETKAYYDGAGWSDGDVPNEEVPSRMTSGEHAANSHVTTGMASYNQAEIGQTSHSQETTEQPSNSHELTGQALNNPLTIDQTSDNPETTVQVSYEQQASASDSALASAMLDQLFTPIVQNVTMDDTAAMFLENTLFSGGDIVKVQALGTYHGESLSLDEHQMQLDPATLRYSIDSANRAVTSYEVHVLPIPNDSLSPQSIEAAYLAAWESGMQKQLPDAERNKYLQLPADMGDRVYKLAAQLAEDAEHDLQLARSIAQYLRANYTYDLLKPEIPGEGVEFVEHFLFEQGFGYCDHFSTAMAVLLRMNDIPSRWVKGFAPGNISVSDDGQVWSDVRTLHAHSWVEAYLPELGWVAFEPTPSYAGSLLPVATAPLTEQTATTVGDTIGSNWWQGAVTMVLSDGGMSVRNASGKEANLVKDDATLSIPQILTMWQERLENVGLTNWQGIALWGIGGAILLASLVVVWLRFRLHLRIWRLERRMRMMERRGGMTTLLEQLWHDIFRKHGQIQPGQTLREYVVKLNLRKQEQQAALVELAVLYETLRFDDGLPERVSRGRMSRLWREALG